MKNLKIMSAVLCTGLAIGLAGCEKKDEPGPRDVKVEPPIKTDTVDKTETNKQAATEEANQAVTAAEDAKKKAEEEAKKTPGGQ